MSVLPKLDPDEIYKAIYQGIYDAMWQMITNATGAPYADFFDPIKSAAHAAFLEIQERH